MPLAHDFARAAAFNQWSAVAFAPKYFTLDFDETVIHHRCTRLSARRVGCTYRFEITSHRLPVYGEAGRIIATRRRGGVVTSHHEIRYTRTRR